MSRKKQRVIQFHSDIEAEENFNDVNKKIAEERLNRELGNETRYLPLLIFYSRYGVDFPDGIDLEAENKKAIRFCFEKKKVVHKISSPTFGFYFVYPVDVLRELYASQVKKG